MDYLYDQFKSDKQAKKRRQDDSSKRPIDISNQSGRCWNNSQNNQSLPMRQPVDNKLHLINQITNFVVVKLYVNLVFSGNTTS